jgi:hypothetical protein
LREIVNDPWKKAALERCNEIELLGKGCKGNYYAQLLATTLPSFINFSILEYDDNVKEVVFGWAITKGRRFEQKCFSTTEQSIVNFFETWFNDLYSAAENIK